MASPTKKVKIRRALRKVSAAKKRKNEARRNGSTAPSLTLNVPNANELAVLKAQGKL